MFFVGPQPPDTVRDPLQVVLQVAAKADAEGHWRHAGPIRDDVLLHCSRFFSLIALCDDHLAVQEFNLFNHLFGTQLTFPELKSLLLRRIGEFRDPMEHVPAFYEAIAEMDIASGTDYSHLVLRALTTFGRMVGWSDGDFSRDEGNGMVYVDRLRGYLFNRGVREIGFHPLVDEFHMAEAGGVGTSALPDGVDETDLEDCLQQLDRLVGLQEVKDDVRTLVNVLAVRRLREKHGLPPSQLSLHLVFSGNPGTGKTTVARLLGGIYRSMGILPKGHVVEVDRSGLVAGYVGQTAIKTMNAVQDAIGGILFIDEAYALAGKRGSADYGSEAIDTLVKAMEDHRSDLVVIAAGYPVEMEAFVHSNPGLRSRFSKVFLFQDYSALEMALILDRMCDAAGYVLRESAKVASSVIIERLHNTRGRNFGNARDVRNLLERALARHATRVVGHANPTRDDLVSLTAEDFASG